MVWIWLDPKYPKYPKIEFGGLVWLGYDWAYLETILIKWN